MAFSHHTTTPICPQTISTISPVSPRLSLLPPQINSELYIIQMPNKFQDARRTFAKVLAENSNQEDSKLLSWVASDDSRLRVFACHVLAHRKSMNSNTLRKILDIRENGRPWAKMAALRCLVEMARGKELEKTHPIRSLKAVPNPMGIDIDQMLE